MDVVYYTNQGGREINEDSLFMTDGAYVVCDGLGGHDSGEVASNCAVKVMSELCAGNPPYTPELINTFYLRANQAVINLKEQALTTMVGGFVRDGIFYYQSVGDSRLYYFRDGKVFAQTKDDSVCQAAVDLGTMNYEDIRTSEDRSRLLKVLGNDPELKIMRKYDPIRMKKGDAFLVCSDGFWEHVLDQEMTENLQNTYDAEEWLNLMLKIQYGRAKNRDDNYTVICAIVEEQDEWNGVEPAEENQVSETGSAAPAATVPGGETVPVNKSVIESALSSIPESKAEKLHDEVDVEHFESMPNKEVAVDVAGSGAFVRRPDAAADSVSDTAPGVNGVPSGETPSEDGGAEDKPYNVPYESQFRRYNDNENVTMSYDDTPQGNFGPDRFDEADREYYEDEYYEEKPEKKGFFARLFRR